MAEKVLEGAVCSENVHKLTTEIDWYKNLHKAEAAAKEQGKLIVWVAYGRQNRRRNLKCRQ